MNEPCAIDSQATPAVQVAVCADLLALNAGVARAFLARMQGPEVRRSHYFEGRYENLYLAADAIAGLPPILDRARLLAGRILSKPPEALRLGFWFNHMGPGERTLPHDHDEDDELLSGTYYLQVPPRSGDLLLSGRYGQTSIRPREGMFVFFATHVLHEVTPNRSAAVRLSLGINVGLRADRTRPPDD